MIWLAIGVGLFFLMGVLPTFTAGALAHTVEKWKELAVYWANVRDIPASLIVAVIQKESKGDPRAPGKTGDYGLMQITQPALTDFNNATGGVPYQLSEMYDPDKNIEVGSWYLAWIKSYLKTADWGRILQAYNAGVGALERDPNVSKDYAREVLAFQDRARSLMV